MKTRTLLALLLLLASATAFAQTPVLVIEDPEADDHGDGTLVYPRRSEFERGDLDLRSLRVFREDGGWRFEASMRNPIKDPARYTSESGGNESLAVFARRGFFAFNLDVYIDTDRIAGSGNTATLPGRGVRIDAAHAWDKAIVLTPRPELMRRQLQETLEQAQPGGGAEVGATIDRSVLFATDVRVRGRSISFFVPGSFLAANQSPDNWSITAFVTAAKLSIETDLRLGNPAGSALERLALGAAQPAAGRPLEAPGFAGDRAPATAVVDLLEPNPGRQEALLRGGGALAGLTRETRVARPATAPAVAATAAAATAAAPAAATGGSWFSRALDSAGRLFGAVPAAAPARSAVVTPAAPASMQSLLQPGSTPTTVSPAAAAATTAAAAATTTTMPVRPTAAAMPAAAAEAAAPPRAPEPRRARDAAFFEEQEYRLRTLRRLRDAGLITEQELEQKRREVIEQL